jgi:DNA-3-methyladenine glycosylase II
MLGSKTEGPGKRPLASPPPCPKASAATPIEIQYIKDSAASILFILSRSAGLRVAAGTQPHPLKAQHAYNTKVMVISTRAPFDFHRTLRFILSPPTLLNGRRFEPLLDHFVDGEYRRAAEVQGQPVLYGVSATRREGGGQPTPALKVRILQSARQGDTAVESSVADLVRRQFSADLDLKPFERLAAGDPALSRLVHHFRGMRIPQAPAVYETLISAILEQQVNLTFAHQVKKALVEAYGAKLEFDGRCYSIFPQPAALAIATPRELRRLQVSGPKARYIIALSRAVLDGSIDLEGLRRLEPLRAHERLLQEKGVGPWTAQYVGLRSLGHLDCLPAADVGLQKAIQRLYSLRKLPSAARVETMARPWAGWRSYATFYLWLTYWEEPEWRTRLAKQIRAERRLAGSKQTRQRDGAPKGHSKPKASKRSRSLPAGGKP